MAEIDLRALLALAYGPDTRESARLRAAQLAAGQELAWLLLLANILAAGISAALLYATVPLIQLTVWATLLFGAVAAVAVRRHAAPRPENEHTRKADIRVTVWEGLALAMLWAGLPVMFFPHLPLATMVDLGIVLAILMTAAAFAMAPLPLATLVFLGALGFATIVQLILFGAFAASVGVLAFTLLLMIICLSRIRALVTIHAARIVLAERDETISVLLREFEDSAADWLWETDAGRRVVRPSPRFARACDREAAAIDGMPILQLLAGPGWDTGTFAAGLRALSDKLRARERFVDLRLPVSVAGHERWWEISAAPRYDDRGVFCGFRGVGSDVTDQRASADKMHRMARFDTLTGLPNRRLIDETLSQAMVDAEQRGGRCAFMMLDLDRFKAVNDTLGHPVGDRLLCQVAERLGRLMTANETCGRLGGDEFAVVIRDGTDTSAVEDLAGRIIASLSRPYDVDQHTLHIGTSIGLAFGPRDGRTSDMLIRSADLALYRAKDAGRGVFRTYEPALHVQAEERRVLEMALHGAIEKGEMSIAYQPIVDTRTGALRGFEALLRWYSPKFGNVPPARFIPLAQEARIIAPIGAWVLKTACEEAARWPSGLRIAVNIAPDQLQAAGFLTMVTTALANSGLPADRLELEVTEGLFLRNDAGATQVLERILDLGVRLSLDDFGTGHSSLGYLSRTRFSSIKIDRSFVHAAARGGREALAIIRAVVALAHSLDIATTAEGVETEGERLLVEELGCTRAQGDLFGRALPVAEARALASRGWEDSAAA